MWTPTKHNPADIATRFKQGFEDSFKQLADHYPFRSGPAHLTNGVPSAIKNGHLIPITELAFDNTAKREAKTQLADTSGDGSQFQNSISASEMILIVATEGEHQHSQTPDQVLLCTQDQQ